MANLRLFTAVELPANIKQSLHQACSLKIPGLRWVDEPLLHITLKFIGDFPEQRLDELTPKLQGAHRCRGKIVLKDWVCFPEHGKVRIVAAGVEDPGAELAKTFESIENICADLGVTRENRKYTPHITLGRAKFPLAGSIRESLKQLPIRELEFGCDGFVLLSSELTQRGPIYRPVSRYIIQ